MINFLKQMSEYSRERADLLPDRIPSEKLDLAVFKIKFSDFDIIAELSTFISKGKSFEAEAGATDDLVMCLVIFSWLANQRYFKELTDVDVRGQMFTEQQNAIEELRRMMSAMSPGR